jgi:hypothetical protein
MKIIAIISAHNEGDIIYHVIGDLIRQGIFVYLIDHCSTDDTIFEAGKWLGKGLIHIERFPGDCGYSDINRTMYVWTDILKRKEELAMALGADWYIHHDADEFREAPFPSMSLAAGIRLADILGFNAIDFSLLNFRPTNNDFKRGDDVRKFLNYFEWGEDYNSLQIKAWKNTGKPVDLETHAGHSVLFEGRRIFPLKFILRHYPVRSQMHGEEKVLGNRKNRFLDEERRKGWHLQYDQIVEGHDFLCSPDYLHSFHPVLTRIQIIWSRMVNGVKFVWKMVCK